MLGINWNYVCKWGGILCTGNTKCKGGGHKNGNNFHRKSHSMDSFINPDALPNKLVAKTFCEWNDNCIYERWGYSGFAMWKVWVKSTSLYDVNHLWIKVLQLCVQSESPTNCFAWINRFYFPHTLNQKSKNIWIQEKKPFRIAIWMSSISCYISIQYVVNLLWGSRVSRQSLSTHYHWPKAKHRRHDERPLWRRYWPVPRCF